MPANQFGGKSPHPGVLFYIDGAGNFQQVEPGHPLPVVASGSSASEGPVDIDSPIATTKPVVVGGRASTATPAAVSADNDVQALWLSRNGAVNASIPVVQALTTITTGRVTAGVATGSTAFVPALAGRKALTIKNSGTVEVWVGPTGVTAANGHHIGPGESFCIEANAHSDNGAPLAYFVITTAAPTSVCTYIGWS